MKIPKIIHQIWFQGEDQIPANLLPYHTSWKKYNPEYEVRVWDQTQIEALINQLENWIKECYFSYKKMIQKIDFAKYAILYTYGGIYMDMDVECFKSLNNTPGLNESDLIVTNMTFVFFHQLMFKCIGQLDFNDRLINNGIIMATKKNEVMYLTMKCADEKKNFTDINNSVHIFVTTGPVCLNNGLHHWRKLNKHNNNNNNTTYKIQRLDQSYFEACDIFEIKQNTCNVPANAIGLHKYSMLWHSKFEHYSMLMMSYIYEYWYIWLGLVILSLFRLKKWRIAKRKYIYKYIYKKI